MISFKIALNSLWRSRWVSTVCGVAIGIGVSATVTIAAVLAVLSADPVPSESSSLYTLRLDSPPKSYRDYEHGDPADSLTWPDAVAILRLSGGWPSAASAQGSSLVSAPETRTSVGLIEGHLRYVTRGYFRLFGMHLIAGTRWSDEEDAGGARVAIVSQTMAQRLYGSASVVGRQVDIARHSFRIVGVAEDWTPQPQFMDSADSGEFFGVNDDFYVPLETAVQSDLDTNSSNCWGSTKGRDWHKHEACSWLQYWVKLSTPDAKSRFLQLVEGYIADQRAHGRFERSEAVQLLSLREWLEHVRVVPSDLKLEASLAFVFFLACLVNIVGLLSAKFSRRRNEMAVRRALGASRKQIFWQVLLEAASIGLLGSVVGVGLSCLGLAQVRASAESYAELANMDGGLLVLTVALSVLGACLAGLLPAWRACKVMPALQLKEE